MLRKCNCGTIATTTKDLELFVKSSVCLHGRGNVCKVCKNIQQNTKRRTCDTRSVKSKGTFINKNESRMYSKYKLFYKDIFSMFKEQQGVCKICSCTQNYSRNNGHTYLAVDHCHSTGRVRGLLCMSCNTALGMFEDNQILLDNAKRYLIEQ